MNTHFTEPTTDYWQTIDERTAAGAGPWQFGYPAALPDGRVLVLPIRQLASEPTHAVASLILNQASLDVVDTLGRMLADRLQTLGIDVLVGLPTLGLALAPVVARELGQRRYVPLGYSRKFWYADALSVPVRSITSPAPGKRLYVDPNQLALVVGKRVAIIDDAVSTGTTMLAAWNLLESLGANVVACGVAMRQSTRWAELLGEARAAKVHGVFDSPLLEAVPDGWALRR